MARTKSGVPMLEETLYESSDHRLKHAEARVGAQLVSECAAAIEGFDEEIAEELRARAKDALLTLAIASEEQLGANEPAEDLLNMDGMDRHLAFILASRGIVTMEDLAEQGVEDLMDIPDMTEERAGELIMTARAPWFAEAEEVAQAQE